MKAPRKGFRLLLTDKLPVNSQQIQRFG